MTAPPPLDPQPPAGAPSGALPQHVAIIMDGNGRWAQARGLPRVRGHHAGAEAVRRVATRGAQLGLKQLTLYSFSHENWKRPAAEVDALMTLCAVFLVQERQTIMANRIRLRQIGDRDGLPEAVRNELAATEALSRDNDGMTLCLALNYGARAEIAAAARSLAQRVAAGTLQPGQIDEAAVAGALQTADMPDPDLVIRTAGEYRISNFLLWQISYSELYVTPVLWPDFDAADLDEALRDFAGRERRYGAIGGPPSSR